MKNSKRAVKSLERLREDFGGYRYKKCLKHLRMVVRKSGLTLEDIGTSEEGLEKLRVNCCKKSAEEYLKDLREGIYPYNHTLGDTLECLRREVKNGGLTLEDIGTSEEELEKLRVNCCKKSAEEYLKDLREGIYP